MYDQALEEALAELGLDARGVAPHEGWEVDTNVLRSVLRRLRGICTHPQVSSWHIPSYIASILTSGVVQVGQLQKQGDRLNGTGALKSIAEVLEVRLPASWWLSDAALY